MTFLGIQHVQITVPVEAVDAARDFYLGVLGMSEIPKPESLMSRGGFWTQIGDQSLHVGIEDGVDRTRTKGHPAFEVDDLEGARAALTAAGVEPLESIPIPGFDRFECRDPFGNRLEFMTKTHS